MSILRVRDDLGNIIEIPCIKGDPFRYEDFTSEQIEALKGKDGSTPYIQNEYWYVNGTSTGVKAKGEDGTGVNVKVSEEECVAIGDAYINAINGHLMILTSTSPKEFTDGGEIKGPKGEDGISISNAAINTLGELVITYSNNTTENLGVVVGRDGADGKDGQDGTNGNDGKDGVSATHYWNGTTLTITSASGTSSVDLKGEPGTSVTILDSYNSYEELKLAHSTGKAGDSYLVNGNLYVWSDTSNDWKNVGNIQGPQGETGATGKDGEDGISIVKTEINSEGELIITYSNGEVSNLGVVIGNDGITPVKGVDYFDGTAGLGVKSITIEEVVE